MTTLEIDGSDARMYESLRELHALGYKHIDPRNEFREDLLKLLVSMAQRIERLEKAASDA